MRAIINFFLLFASLGCSQEKKADDNGWDVVIKGKVNFPQKGIIQIQELRMDGSGQPEMIELKKDNTYAKTVHLTEPAIMQLDFFGMQRVNLMVDRSTIEVQVDGNSQQGAVSIKGSPDHDLYAKVQTMYQSIPEAPELKKIEADFQVAAEAKNEPKLFQLRAEYVKQMEALKNKIIDVLRQAPASLALYNILQDQNVVDRDKNMDLFISSLAKFQKSWPSFHYTKELEEMVTRMKVTAIGQMAPEITLPNPSGDTIKLSSLRGKYVLVDFWAKWCGPCRQENPNVVRAYHKFKSKGFEIYSVSLDKNKEDWLKAIKDDGLEWTHVSDLKYWNSIAARDYNITGIPFSILLDKDGKIIAKNLRGAALDEKLTEVLGK